MLTAVVMTYDKNDLSPQTLASVAFADEIIIKECGEISDFAAVRNEALKKAKGEWVLFIDSDEVVSKELAEEIRVKIQDLRNKTQGYYLRRQDCFWGKTLHFGETGNIKLLRLAQKEAGRWQRKVHEVWRIPGPVGELRNPLNHFPHQTIFDFISSINHYSDLDATELCQEDKGFSYWRTIANPLAKFTVNYFLKLGFLDGFAGFVMAFMMSFQSLVTRVKQYDFS